MIKSRINEKKSRETPILMKHNSLDIVVLFTEDTTGMVVYSNTDVYEIGYYSDSFESHRSGSWTVLNYPIEIANC